MAATTQEVASHVQRTADATQQANVLTGRGREVARDTREAIERLSAVVGETGVTVAQLARDSDEIGTVVDVIKGIADQTNLLALNARDRGGACRGYGPRLCRSRRRSPPIGATHVALHHPDP